MNETSRLRRLRRVLLLAGVLAGAVSLLAACSSPGSPAGAAGGGSSSKPDFAYFKGKTITYIIPFAPGTTPGIEAVAYQKALASYLHATVNLEYMSSGAPVIAWDTVAKADPNGLTIGMIEPASALNDIYTHSQPTSFSLQSASYIGSTKSGPAFFVACEGASFSSLSQLVRDNDPVSAITQLDTQADLSIHLLEKAYGFPATYLGGYTPSTELAGCLRGDGNFGSGAVTVYLDAAHTAMTPGIKPLLLGTGLPAGSAESFLNKEVPTLAQFAKTDPPKTAAGKQALSLLEELNNADVPGNTTFGPAGIPAPVLLALRDALAAVSSQASVQQALLSTGTPAGNLTPSQVQSFFTFGISHEAQYEQDEG